MNTLTIIIPYYNELNLISEVLQKVMNLPIPKEVILVDDSSTDGSAQFLDTKISRQYPDIKIISHARNRGKGAAIRTGLEQTTGDLVVIQDADLEYDPNDLIRIYKAFEDPNTHVVYGSRFGKINNKILYLHHYFGIQLLNFIVKIFYKANITDEATCYKAFRKDVLGKIQLRCEGFEFCPEITAKVCKAGYTIQEIPVSYFPRTHLDGKKIHWTHGFQAIFTLIKYRFVD